MYIVYYTSINGKYKHCSIHKYNFFDAMMAGAIKKYSTIFAEEDDQTENENKDNTSKIKALFAEAEKILDSDGSARIYTNATSKENYNYMDIIKGD